MCTYQCRPHNLVSVYTNVLGRDYDQSWYNDWLGNLNNGLETRNELLLGFVESTENQAIFIKMTEFGWFGWKNICYLTNQIIIHISIPTETDIQGWEMES